MIRQIFWLFSTVSTLILIGHGSVRGSEQEFIELLQRSQRVVIATPEKSVDLREADGVQFRVDRALRGPGAKGEMLEVAHNGSDSDPKFEANRQYVMLLSPNHEASGWVYLGSTAIPYSDASMKLASDEQSGDATTVTLEKLLALIDKYPPSADMMLPFRSTPGGRWVAIIVIEEKEGSAAKIEMPLWILDLKKQGDGYEADIIAHADDLSELSLVDFTYADETIQFSIDLLTVPDKAKHRFKFSGRLRDGLVKGNLRFDDGPARLAQLRPTTAKTIAQTTGKQPLAGQDVLDEATEAEDEFAAYQNFVKEYPDSPLVLDAYLRQLSSESVNRLNEEQLRDLVQNFLDDTQEWGEEIRQKSVIDAALVLASQKSHPELALELIAQAEERLKDSGLSYLEEVLSLQKPLVLWEAGEKERAITLLEEYHKKHPFNAISTYHLARMYEEQRETEKALVLYAELVSLPNMLDMVDRTFESDVEYTPLLEKLDELWRSKYGNRQALPQFSYNAYYSAIHNYTDERVEPREEKPGSHNRVALMELMTGAACPTCVAADLASSILEHVFQNSELIVLRYHLHNPGPDPMATAESEQRFKYYQGRGIPIMAINGKTISGGGYIVHVPEMLDRYRRPVDAMLDDSVDFAIKLSANAEPGKIKISAEAERPEGFSGDMRLRIVLAEERLPHKASNGILLHENVVRRMVGGPEGIAPQEGKLEFQGEVDLGEYSRDLETYLTGFEDMFSNSTGQDFKFEIRPISPFKLNLIAFVQDDKTKEVLQAAIVPVIVPEKPAE